MIRSFVWLVVVVSLATGAQLPAATFYMASNGQDTNPGTVERPLATLAAARDAARKAGAGPHRIVVTPGEYYLEQPVAFDAHDNGLTIEAEPAGKAVFFGGTRVTGWRRDGDRFWCADVPGVKEGQRDFRELVVGSAMPPRARMPESGTFLHRSVFPVPWLSSVGGGWERKPTQEELTTMIYDPKDVPATLNVKNAEVRVYHMWDESLVGVAANDVARSTLTFTPPSHSPPGAFGVKKYVIFNTREGMTQAGQWYLDRTAGRVVYWPLPGQEMAKTRVVAPSLERLVQITGTKKQPVEKLTLRGLVFQATRTPLKPSGFGAGGLAPAVTLTNVRQCVLEGLEICNVGGQGLLLSTATDCLVRGCHIHHIGACGLRVSGSNTEITRNHIHHLGVYHSSAVAVSASHTSADEKEKGLHLYRNEIHDAPYSGIAAGGSNHLIEENLIYRVMRELQDGAAIYGGLVRTVLRGNVVRDVVKMGEGYGISAYYFDEGARDCIIERNVSIGVERPTHNHIARNTIIRDNVFIADGDITLSIARSSGCTVERNTLFVPGKLKVSPTSAITTWRDNVVFHDGVDKQGAAQAFTIDDALPPSPVPQRKKWGIPVVRAEVAPTIDGDVRPDEWPGSNQRLDRGVTRDPAVGAPMFFRMCYDDRCLYVMVMAVMFDTKQMRKGTQWGHDDGAEVCIAGRTADGRTATYVLHGFACGKLESVTLAGAPAADAERVGRATRFATKDWKKWGGGWYGEWAIPFDALGLKPKPGLKVPFNLGAFRAEDGVWLCWEGTLGPNWRLDEAGAFQLK